MEMEQPAMPRKKKSKKAQKGPRGEGQDKEKTSLENEKDFAIRKLPNGNMEVSNKGELLARQLPSGIWEDFPVEGKEGETSNSIKIREIEEELNAETEKGKKIEEKISSLQNKVEKKSGWRKLFSKQTPKLDQWNLLELKGIRPKVEDMVKTKKADETAEKPKPVEEIQTKIEAREEITKPEEKKKKIDYKKELGKLRIELKRVEEKQNEPEVLRIEDEIRKLEIEASKQKDESKIKRAETKKGTEAKEKMKILRTALQRAEEEQNETEVLRIEDEIHKLEGGGSKQREETETTQENTPEKPQEENKQKEVEPSKQEAEIKIEVENLSEKDKEKLGWGLKTLGFRVEKMKNDFFAGTLNLITKRLDKKNTTGRFFTELKDTFVRDSEDARKKGLEIKEGKGKLSKLRNFGMLTGNVLKYGRIVADVTGASIANPFRYVMMGGMATTRVAEAGKEARFKNEDVMEKTRIEDAEKAAEEAWKIYENAQKNSGSQNVSLEELKKAYLMEMPKDIQKRLENPVAALGFVQKLMSHQIDTSISNLNEKIAKIENGPKSEVDKKLEKEKLLQKWEKDLKDYDRMLTQYGTVDQLAMSLRYTQQGGKLVVLGMQIETAFVSMEKLFGAISNINFHDMHPIEGIGSWIHEHNPFGHQEIPNTPNTTAPKLPENLNINPESVIHKGEGIENAFIRQIEHDPKLAHDLGFDPKTESLRSFAQHQAHIIATKEGYVDNTGHEIRVAEADKVAYEIKTENGHPVVSERMVADGKIIETHHEGDAFNKEEVQKYEYKYNAPHEQTNHIATTPQETISPEHTTLDNYKIPASETQNIDLTQGHDIEASTPVTPTAEDIARTKVMEIATKHEIFNYQDLPLPEQTARNVGFLGNATFPQQPGGEYHYGAYAGVGNKTEPFEFSGIHGTGLKEAVDAMTKDKAALNLSSFWEGLKNIKANTLLEQAGSANIDTANGRLAQYLVLLKNFSGLKPNTGVFGLRAESVEHYMARALQNLEVKGKLEDFEASVRK